MVCELYFNEAVLINTCQNKHSEIKMLLMPRILQPCFSGLAQGAD